MPSNARERIFRPQLTFDEDLVDLAGFVAANGLEYDGIDGDRLLALAKEQREEREEDGRLMGVYRANHEAFIRNQANRFSVYMQALEHARAKFREDGAKLKELDRFRRYSGRNGNGKGSTDSEETVTEVASVGE